MFRPKRCDACEAIVAESETELLADKRLCPPCLARSEAALDEAASKIEAAIERLGIDLSDDSDDEEAL